MAKKVLVVDDEKLIVKGIRFSLEQDGMDVDVAYDGEQALEAAHNNQYDVILLDVMLPKMSGFEVCQQIREFSDVPVIMLTAKGDDMDRFSDWNTAPMIISPNPLIYWKSRPGSGRSSAAAQNSPAEKKCWIKVRFSMDRCGWTEREGGYF